jgi:phage major head subunit gpT-like protein
MSEDRITGTLKDQYTEILASVSRLGIANTYDWLGDWQGPGSGQYVIRRNDKEMEPGEVIALLDDYADLIEQTKRTVDNDIL